MKWLRSVPSFLFLVGCSFLPFECVLSLSLSLSLYLSSYFGHRIDRTSCDPAAVAMNLGRHSTLSSLSKAMASKVTSVADFFFFYFSGIAPQGEDGEGGGRWKGSGIDIWLKVNYDPPRRISISTWRLKVCFGGEKGNGTWWPGATFFLNEKHFRLSKSLAGRAHRKWIDAAISWWFSFNSHPISIRATGQNKRAREKEPQLRMLIRDRKVAPFITAPALRWDSGRARNELAGQSL